MNPLRRNSRIGHCIANEYECRCLRDFGGHALGGQFLFRPTLVCLGTNHFNLRKAERARSLLRGALSGAAESMTRAPTDVLNPMGLLVTTITRFACASATMPIRDV